ncbi:hypothetical protein QFW77_14590 [Luteimonas sp. RD2P54]|uniref:Uncharacterized protein n=1 Tax=Luteimonas endophytica TaxID=3042023 RepID=A0ABT6JBK3_9GAMM|nr:hypothetical protein [Luteimonas endophytica]MDH5824206.1 hypothetical protein [Luteimonas endophytica]
MAENEYLDLGHPRRWQQTRDALDDPACTSSDIVSVACEDLEGVCEKLPGVLRRGPSLALLLKPVLESPSKAQVVLSQFTEKGLAQVVEAACKLAGGRGVAAVADAAATRIIDRLIDQLDLRAGQYDRFRSFEMRQQLRDEAAEAFRIYREPLRNIIEASLRDGPIQPYKRRIPLRPKLTPRQVTNLSVAAPQRDPTHAR